MNRHESAADVDASTTDACTGDDAARRAPWRVTDDPLSDSDALEAMLFAAGEPVSRSRLLQAFATWLGVDLTEDASRAFAGDEDAGGARADAPTGAAQDRAGRVDAVRERRRALSMRLDAAIERLRARHDGRGVELVETASGLWFRTPARCADAVRALLPERPSRPSRALLETLAVIAYRQPVTRGEIEAVRGVAVSASVIRALLEREWVRVVGHQETPGRPALFATTQRFLDDLGLQRLEDLPPLEELRARGRDELDRLEVSDAALRRRAQADAATAK